MNSKAHRSAAPRSGDLVLAALLASMLCGPLGCGKEEAAEPGAGKATSVSAVERDEAAGVEAVAAEAIAEGEAEVVQSLYRPDAGEIFAWRRAGEGDVARIEKALERLRRPETNAVGTIDVAVLLRSPRAVEPAVWEGCTMKAQIEHEATNARTVVRSCPLAGAASRPYWKHVMALASFVKRGAAARLLDAKDEFAESVAVDETHGVFLLQHDHDRVEPIYFAFRVSGDELVLLAVVI